MFRSVVLYCGAASLMLCAFLGCSRRGGKIAPKPNIDPAASAKQAIAEYDANHDGKLDIDELKKCPALLGALNRLDKDRDRQLSAEEIAARIQQWVDSRVIVVIAMVTIKLDGRPLAEATVTLEPEKFLGSSYQSSNGVTDKVGRVSFQGAIPGFAGVYPGFYRVRVSRMANGKEAIPAKYNTDSELGCEFAKDEQPIVEFDLKSR